MKTYRLYGFDECPYCAKALDLLLFEPEPTDVVKLPTLEERKAFMDERGFKPPHRTFPRVYTVENGVETLIGGHDDLAGYLARAAA